MLQRIARHGNSMRAPARQCLRCCLAAKSSMPARSDESSSIAPSASSRSSRESRGTASLTYSPRYEEPASSSTMKSGLKRRIPGQSPQTSAATSAKQPQHQALPQPAVIVTNSSQHSAPSFYRRQLPTTHCIPFSSAEGRRIFQEALQGGGLESYFPLSEQFKTQDDPAFCGLGALTMVLNALAIDPGRTWKGPWRWFDESMLECCEPLEVVRSKGICIGKLDCLARCNGATTMLKYGDSTGLAEFREDIIRMTSTSPPPNELMIVGYNRKILGQTGTGHFSPVGGYHAGRDMALIMDVARFKYPPHWVSVPLLWEAMQTVDPETERSRGYIIVAKGLVSESLLFTIDKARYKEFEALAIWLREAALQLPPLMRAEMLEQHSQQVDHEQLLPVFLESLPASVASMVTTYHDALCLQYSERHLNSINQLLAAIEEHPIFAYLSQFVQQDEAQLGRFREGWGGCCARKVVNEKHVLTIMYISVLEWVCLREGWPISRLFPHAVYSPALQTEVGQLKRKFAAMADEVKTVGNSSGAAPVAVASACSIPSSPSASTK